MQYKNEIPEITKTIERHSSDRMNEFLRNISDYQHQLYSDFRENLKKQTQSKYDDIASQEKKLEIGITSMREANEDLNRIEKIFNKSKGV